MSTSVDNSSKQAVRPRSSSAQTRTRVLTAAGVAFSRAGFDHVGVREIARAAATDPAIVIRLFGSKEALFSQIAAGAFSLETVFQGPLDGLGERVAYHLLSPSTNGGGQPEAVDEFQLLLRSAASPVAGPILAASLQAGLIAPLAERIGGEEAPSRAALIAGYVIGVSALRATLATPALDTPTDLTLTRLGQAIQMCVEA